MSLLTSDNAKTIKGEKLGFQTAILYLAPFNLSGTNLCPMAAVAECGAACLNSAGRGVFNSVQAGRLRKALYFLNDYDRFMLELVQDIARHARRCDRAGTTPLIRLNGTSDILWERKNVLLPEFTAKRIGKAPGEYASVMEMFPEVQFYDYTKIAHRDNVPANYDLTFSYSGVEAYQKHVTKAVNKGMRIAVVFRKRDEIPSEFLGKHVVDGDDTDIRHLDPIGSIVALYAKGKARHDTSGFVVDVEKTA